MTKQVIQIGTAPNTGTGDPLRTAFSKVNENFTELYDRPVFSGSYNDLTNTPTIPSVTGLASETFVNNAINTIPPVDLSPYALTSQIPDVSNFITAADIPTIPTDVSELTDTQGLLGQGSDSIFDENGNITFPDETVQTTAWAGGRVVATPLTSLGSEGDRAGDLSFDGNYFYYCRETYSATPTTVSWSNVTEFNDGAGDHYIQATIAEPSLLNGTLSITNITVDGAPVSTESVTNFAQVSGNTYKFYLDNSEPWQSFQNSQLQVISNIWKRVAWSNDTW
jgi:hypothetical protein